MEKIDGTNRTEKSDDSSTDKGKSSNSEKKEKEQYCLYKVKYIGEGVEDNKEYMENIKKINEALSVIYQNWKVPDDKKEEEKDKIESIVTNILDQVRFFFKSSDYAHEKELRVVKLYTGDTKLNDSPDFPVPKLYIDMELDLHYKEVILEPKVEKLREIAIYLGYTGNVDKITKSKIKYQ